MSGSHIDIDRLWSTIQYLGEVGRDNGGSLTREDGTEADKAARDTVIEWFENAGLIVEVDPIGNIVARKEGEQSLPPIRTGSHIDTPPNGGKFDGVVGVLSPLEIARSWNERGVTTAHPIEIVVFSLEELSRFDVGMVGSQVAAGDISLTDAYEIEDEEGTTIKQAFENIGYIGDRDLVTFESTKAFIELHVEQGPVLDQKNYPVGVVEAITGITGHKVTFSGETDHAGGTPMDIRRDAFASAAEFATEIEQLAVEKSTNSTAVATVGRVEIEPNAMNVIPGEVVLRVDIRDTDKKTLDTLIASGKETAAESGERRDVDVTWEEIYYRPPTPMDLGIVEQISTSCREHGLEVYKMPSGGGHDSMNIAPVAPTGMIFVPSEDGISHSPDEYTEPGDIEKGTQILEHTLLEIDNDDL